MIDIRSNFFYARPMHCELWCLNRDKVLMLDTRPIYCKVTVRSPTSIPSNSMTRWPSSGCTGARLTSFSRWSPAI